MSVHGDAAQLGVEYASVGRTRVSGGFADGMKLTGATKTVRVA